MPRSAKRASISAILSFVPALSLAAGTVATSTPMPDQGGPHERAAWQFHVCGTRSAAAAHELPRLPFFLALDRKFCEIKTMRVLSAAMMLLLITTPTIAASPKVEGAIKVLQAVGTDANKLKIFCELMDVDEKRGDREDPVL